MGLSIDDEVWDHSTFSKNRDRLLDHGIVGSLFEEVVELARKQDLISEEHFSVDGTLIQAWASQKSFLPKDDEEPPTSGGRNECSDFRGKRRLNDTHESRTDPEAKNYKKSNGSEAKMSYLGHTLMENRHGLIIKAKVTQASGSAEREAALEMLTELPGKQRRTLGADKGYDTKGFVEDCRGKGVTPHVAMNTARKGGSAIDGRTSRHEGYRVSQRIRKRIEEGFGWGKTIGLIRQVKVRGKKRVNGVFLMTFMGWNLTRMKNVQESYA